MNHLLTLFLIFPLSQAVSKSLEAQIQAMWPDLDNMDQWSTFWRIALEPPRIQARKVDFSAKSGKAARDFYCKLNVVFRVDLVSPCGAPVLPISLDYRNSILVFNSIWNHLHTCEDSSRERKRTMNWLRSKSSRNCLVLRLLRRVYVTGREFSTIKDAGSEKTKK